ncbi:hypothetical protein N9A94_04145 [Akkermansiaceae bacterium]|nr:hypothetical protein [Akkermansiaceae bacterium]MDB4544346.1 hypothetical protein [Akkermansiaceae bacterium]
MKNLIFLLLLTFSPFASGLSVYDTDPSPVACFTGSATQAAPFTNWGLQRLYDYAAAYYTDMIPQADYLYNVAYGWCTSQAESETIRYLKTTMEERWRTVICGEEPEVVEEESSSCGERRRRRRRRR